MMTIRRFKTDERGATAMLFGLAIVPLMGFAGAAIDYSRAASARTIMQKAVDGTALALARQATGLKDRELQARAHVVFRQLFQPDSSVTAEPVKVTRTGKTIRVAANGSVRTAVMTVLGFKDVEISSEAEVAWGTKKIELALVLDNTGSMNEVVRGRKKIEELRKASLDLLSKLNNAARENEDIKVAIVPFDTHVRVDANANRYASWLRLAAGDRQKWHGYIEDRGDDAQKTAYDTNDERADTAHPESLYPAVLGTRGGQELAPVQPLVSVLDGYRDLTRTAEAMRGVGCTNITVGASWGMATLSKHEPFGGAADASANLEKIMVVVTDGDNTRNRWHGDCRENTPASVRIDARTEMACNQAKTDGIRVITIRLMEGNARLLRGCATTEKDPKSAFYNQGKPLYFDVQNPADLGPAFQALLNMMLETRFTH
jgi:Flp pilus assembly protein TadG